MNRAMFRVLVAASLLIVAIPGHAQDRTQMRSVTMTRYGVVSAESPLAAQAGAQILARGGNAIEAAIATNAVMGVVEPMMNGMGGDLFAIVYEAKSGKLYGLDASGWSPKGLTPEYLKAKGVSAMPGSGIDSVTVPGAVDGWAQLLTRFGHMNFQQLLAPAIHYAREGFPVPEWTAAYWANGEGHLSREPSTASVYLVSGHAPHEGELFRNEELARSTAYDLERMPLTGILPNLGSPT
jgi:gamma-glutamyltranspeptidase / glutathione hydrolase